MSLSFDSRRAGGVTVVTCAGRIVEGPESVAFDQEIDKLLPFTPYVVLHLGAVEFIDSSGLGLLVRLLHRTRRAGGNLTLCAAPTRIAEALRMTRLSGVFDVCASETDAIAACYERAKDVGTPFGAPDVLCVHESPDVLAYVRELLGRSGHVVISASNLPDALMLLRATRPKAVVIGNELHGATSTSTGESFNRLADQIGVVVLSADFATHDAGEAGEDLLARVRALVTPTAASN